MTNNNFDRSNVENIYPLAPMQQGLLFHTLLAPGSGAYVPQIVLTLRGALDGARMAQSWQRAVDRHVALRTAFYWEQRDEPYQIVFRSLPLHWVEQDWRGLDENVQRARLEALMAGNRAEPFRLQRPPLMRLFWIRVDEERYQLLWCYHHLILDGWSAAQLVAEVLRDYIAPAAWPTPRPYADFVAWIAKQDKNAALDFWRCELANFSAVPQLPKFSALPIHGTLQPARADITLDKQQSAALRTFARDHQLTLNTLMQAALALLLRRYGNDGDIVFGTTVSGRPAALEQSMTMVGLFINTVPVCVRMNPASDVLAWLHAIQAQRLAAADHEYIPLRELQAACNNGQPLFDCLLVFESYPTATGDSSTSGHDMALDNIAFDESTHFPLILQIADGDELHIGARYDLRNFDVTTIDTLLAHLQQLLLALIAQPQARIGEIGLKSSQPLAGNSVDAAFPQSTLADLFEQQVGLSPMRCALIDDASASTLDYDKLNRRANQLAHALIAMGIGNESIVAVHIERSLALMVALIAIQKAGAAWLPLDTGNPAARLRDMVIDARPMALLYDSAAISDIAALRDLAGDVPLIDCSSVMLQSQSDHNPNRNNTSQSAAYVIYTSGSTGRPKGVVNHQAGIVNRLHWMQQYLQLTEHDRVLQKTPLGFDVSVWELFLPLITGSTLVLARPGGHTDRDYLADVIERQRVNVLHFVPAMLADFLEAPATGFSSVRDVVCSGEALTATLQQRFSTQLPDARLHNLYGPTEAAVDVTAWLCESKAIDPVPIGHAISNLHIHLLDGDGHEVPQGAAGRLFIGGIGVARGYLNRPALTAERFVPNPFATQGTDAVLYDSGDMARRRIDGAIEYLGRADDQIKLRGVRIEPGEIEAALNALPAVRQAVVRYWPQLAGGAQLAGYVVANAGASLDTNALILALRAQLPDAMVPSTIIVLDKMPVGPNGKPDRRALPAPTSNTHIYIAARTDNERALAAIWRDALKLDTDPGISDNFFALGGHSLIATRVVNRIRQQLNIELSLQHIFEYPQLQALAAQLDRLQAASAASSNQRREISI